MGLVVLAGICGAYMFGDSGGVIYGLPGTSPSLRVQAYGEGSGCEDCGTSTMLRPPLATSCFNV
jgi:hypothetical protein